MFHRNTGFQDVPTIPLEHCLAKSRSLHGQILPGRTVEQHCRIVGAVAETLLNVLPDTVRHFFPDGTPFMVSLHDVGKIFPSFQAMLHHKVSYEPSFLQLKEQIPSVKASIPHHSEVSWAALKAVHGRKSPLAEIAAWHHGKAPSRQLLKATDETCGGSSWQQHRVALIECLRGGQDWPEVHTPEELIMLKGLTVVADWIGSGPIFDDPAEDWRPLVPKAVERAGFRPVRVKPNKSFQDIFAFSPNPMQEAMMRLVTEPGVYVLEAPMGMGKTEAALFAAYRMLEAGKARGLYFALPTQLTSNKIYDRLIPYLKAILIDTVDPLLLHGMAWLYASHDEDDLHASSWFAQSKRGLLAPFGAGTLDQALMSVINVRHPHIRSFGLAGKVVILDEVHSYDAYTGILLDTLVKHLRALGCTIIILSATLTKSRLVDILDNESLHSSAYPLITSENSQGIKESSLEQNDACRNVSVKIRMGIKEQTTLEEALLRAEQGQQVLWIENTVKEAQALYRQLAARATAMEVKVGLLHSRFTPSDRQSNETYWTQLYGKHAQKRSMQGHILIGTQVLEQSLDIDADFLITRLCPTDMLFQRLGRLWRHKGTMRPAEAQRECWILTPTLNEAYEKEQAFGPSGAVYSPYVLTRTLEIWAERDSVSIPDQIRPLLEATYSERPLETEPSPLARKSRLKLEKERSHMRTLALASQSEGQTLPDCAATRLIEDEVCPLLMVQELNEKRCILADGQVFHFKEVSGSTARRREISAMIFSNIVHVRSHDLALPCPINKHREKRRLFEHWLPVKENYEGIFLACLRPDNSLEDLCTPGLGAGHYSSALGWWKDV